MAPFKYCKCSMCKRLYKFYFAIPIEENQENLPRPISSKFINLLSKLFDPFHIGVSVFLIFLVIFIWLCFPILLHLFF